jgi:hypothetical protein
MCGKLWNFVLQIHEIVAFLLVLSFSSLWTLTLARKVLHVLSVPLTIVSRRLRQPPPSWASGRNMASRFLKRNSAERTRNNIEDFVKIFSFFFQKSIQNIFLESLEFSSGQNF